MTPEEFTAICKQLFGRKPDGYGWKADMNRKTGVSLRTLQAWASGKNRVPVVVAALLRIIEKLLKGKDYA